MRENSSTSTFASTPTSRISSKKSDALKKIRNSVGVRAMSFPEDALRLCHKWRAEKIAKQRRDVGDSGSRMPFLLSSLRRKRSKNE